MNFVAGMLVTGIQRIITIFFCSTCMCVCVCVCIKQEIRTESKYISRKSLSTVNYGMIQGLVVIIKNGSSSS